MPQNSDSLKRKNTLRIITAAQDYLELLDDEEVITIYGENRQELIDVCNSLYDSVSRRNDLKIVDL